MIEAGLLSVWDCLVGSVALISIIVLAFCVMVRAVKPGDVLRYLGVIVGVVILLIMLPAIITGLWSSMSLGQHLGVALCAVLIGWVLIGMRRRTQKDYRR